jgi:hypothetical protein
MSATPKDHCIEYHAAVQLMVLHQGIGDLGGGDQGEQNHQLESKEDSCLGSGRSFQRREAYKKSKQDGIQE